MMFVIKIYLIIYTKKEKLIAHKFLSTYIPGQHLFKLRTHYHGSLSVLPVKSVFVIQMR